MESDKGAQQPILAEVPDVAYVAVLHYEMDCGLLEYSYWFFHLSQAKPIAATDKTIETADATKAVIGQKLSKGPPGSTVGSTATTANAATMNVRTSNTREIAT